MWCLQQHWGAKRKKRVPLVEFARDLDPNSDRSYFDNNRCELRFAGYFWNSDQKILADDNSDEQRIKIFEEVCKWWT